MKKSRLPLPGQRIYRSSIAVAFCMLIYVLRGYEGIPLFSAIAAMQCIQPNTKETNLFARKRILGTVIGAAWGLFQLLFEIELIRSGILDERLHYAIVPLMLIPLLYSTTVLKIQETAFISGITFLSITINHFTPGSNPYLFAFNRLLDTVIGVLVASVVNRLHLPHRKNTDTLYVLALEHATTDTDSRLSAFSIAEFNRMMEDGAKISISTDMSQATLRQILPGIKLHHPIITMDGAALYDMSNLEYISTNPMSEAQTERIVRRLQEIGLPFFSNIIEQNLLVIRYAELDNKGMQQVFEKNRSSPYRNFIKSEAGSFENVVSLMAIDTDERIEAAYEELMQMSWIGEYRIVKSILEHEGYSYIKIYNASCTRGAMLRELEELMGAGETVTLGAVPGKYDVFVENADLNLLIRELKRRFEPVDFRCWKSVFRW